MAKKFNLSKNKTFNNKTAIQNNLNTIITNPTYESKVDYTSLQVTSEEKTQLINYEQVITKKREAISLSLMELSTALYNAQQILSQRSENGDGRFYSWFEQLGLSKSFVYRCLEKYKLYLISNMEIVMDLTVKEASMITKALNSNVIKEEEVIEIIESDNIVKLLDEKINGPIEKTVVDLTSFKKQSKEEQLEEYKRSKQDLKKMSEDLYRKRQQLKDLKENISMLSEQIKMMKEISKNMKIEIDNIK